ncbi:MAG: rod shape-determining protein MreD [Bacteroidales bacterium]|nr:rod shape-determining protein MreD [Bacteroidales bacterium]
MNNGFVRYSLMFVFLVLIQVLFLNNIELGGSINPFLYILFILILPFETPSWMLLVLGFFLGFSIDIFVNTLGIHTSASVFAAFVRPMVLSLIIPRDGYESGTLPRISFYGLPWFIRYSFSIVFAHHLFYFFMEAFTFSGFFNTFGKVLYSFAFTIALVFVGQLFVTKKK